MGWFRHLAFQYGETLVMRLAGVKRKPIPLTEGQTAPDFTLPNAQGEEVSLSSFRDSRAVVLYFYPKDDTPGCTIEAKAFRDDYAAIQAAGAEILGISTDDSSSHAAFTAKYNLPFPLLADPEGTVCRAYGVHAETRPFAFRATFIIDREGRISRIFNRVNPDGHSHQILTALQK